MRLSPPITVLAILAVMITGTVWLAPPPQEAMQITVVLPTATHQKLAQWGADHPGTDGRPLTVLQAIEELASN